MVFVKHGVAVSVLVGTIVLGSGYCYAGFQLSDSSASLQSAPAVQPSSLGDKKETQAAPLQIFEDRYVPDSVLKKYNLKEDWYSLPTDSEIPPPVSSVQTLEITAVNPVTPLESSQTLSARPLSVNIVDTWRARKGENVRDVLQRWSDRSQTSLMWASPDTPILQKDFSFIGKYHDAVNQLIKLEGGANIHSQYRSEGLNPVMMEPASTVTTNTTPSVDKEVAVPHPQSNPFSEIFQPVEKKEDKSETRWFGLSGAPLAEVIQVWAEDADVQVIWKSEKNFALKESVSQTGYFEDAIFKALNQYNDDQIRPVGELYKDPATGKKVLVVKTEIN